MFGAVVDFLYVTRCQRAGGIDSRLGDRPRGLHGALVQMSEAIGPYLRPPVAVMTVAAIAGVAVAVAVDSPAVTVGSAKEESL